MSALYVFLKKSSSRSSLLYGENMNKKIKKQILHLFFPTRCPICGEIINCNEDFCKSCNDKLTPFNETCIIQSADSFTSAYIYDDVSSKAIMLLKNGICGNSAYAFGKKLAEIILENKINEKTDILIPVPLHKSSEHKRGFNQSELIAKELSEIINLPVCRNAVIKQKRTIDQKTLTYRERLVNLKDAFIVNKPDLIKGKRILLVDDVCTTGSTLTELSKLLRKNGAVAIHCAVCCKTLVQLNKTDNCDL